MRTSNLLALSCIVAGGCSAERIGAHQEADTLTGSVYITQVYGGGGNANALFDHDYVELKNLSSDAVTLSAYSIFYRSSTGSTWMSTPLPANLEIPAGGNYLITESSTAAIGAAISGDTKGTIPMALGAGVVALATTATTAPVAPTPGGTTVDLVGYGTGTTLYAGTGPAPTPSSTKADIRMSELGDNKMDFVAGTPAPVNAATSPDMDIDMQPDLTPVVDMVVTDAGPFTALLNEVKFNPVKTDDAEEYIELIGTGTLPPHTFVVSVSGDAENPKGSTVGHIDYAYDVSATGFGSNGLILIQAATTTFPNVPAATKLLLDPNLNTAKLGNFTETAMLIQVNDPVATPIKTGGTIPAPSAYTILDSIAVREPITTDGGTAGVPDPIYGVAVLEACASELPGKLYPPSGASRIVGNLTVDSASAWYAGQAYGTVSSDQYLSNVADCSTATGAPQTWSQSPGLPNDMPFQAIPDLLNAPIVDLSTPASGDLAVSGGEDLSADVPDLGRSLPTNDGGSTVTPGGTIGGSGCAQGGRGAIGWPVAMFFLGLAGLLRSRRRT